MSHENKEENHSNIGKIITFGSLNLFLNLRLEKEDLRSNNFNALQNLQDLSFIIENEKLWQKIELTSKNKLINSLFRMNKIKQNKNIVSYLVFDKINLRETQTQFQKLLDSVLLDNGLVIYSHEVCNCHISINLKLFYKKKMKKFVIYGQEDYDEDEEININNGEEEIDKKGEEEKDNKTENSKKENESNKNKGKEEKEENIENQEKKENLEEDEEEDINDIGIFENIPEEVKFENFKYLYIYYNDYIQEGELFGKLKLNQMHNFLVKLKKNSQIKIIFNFGKNFGNDEKNIIKFLKVSDIHIFRERNELLQIMRNRKSIEEKEKEKESKKLIDLLRTQKISRKQKLYNIDSKNSSMTNIKQNQFNYSSREGLHSSTSTFKHSMNKSQSTKNFSTSSYNKAFESNNKGSLDKNNIHRYLREMIYMSNIREKYSNYTDKLGIYLDEYKKIYIVKYKRNSFVPDVIEYDLNIYPKSNVHNLKEIYEVKYILMKNNDKYTSILESCILCNIIDDCDNYFMYNYYSHISILKLLALEKNKMPIPKDKDFYIVQIDQKELNKMIKEENTKQKEEGFNNNHFQMKYKGNDSKYYPLMDKFLTSYMQSMVNIDVLKKKNLINEKKRILYDPEYKDIVKFGNYNPEDMNNQKFANFILKDNFSRNLKNIEKDYKKEFMNKKPEMKYYLPGINGIPEYIVYLNKEERKKILKNRLPLIKKKKKPKEKKIEEIIFFQNNNPRNVEKNPEILKGAPNKLEDKEGDDKDKINIDNYKEIKFQNTQLEAKNL